MAGLNGIYWFAMSFSCYQAVYLQNEGFSASSWDFKRACFGSGHSVRFLLRYDQRQNRLRQRILVMILTTGVGLYALIPLIPTGLPVSPVLFLIFIPLINFFRGSMTNFTDNILVRNCNSSV